MTKREELDWKRRVVAGFERAAPTYAASAQSQRDIAVALAEWMEGLVLAVPEQGLELGCGTGLLSQELLLRWPHTEWRLTDVSPAMLEEARARLGARATSATWQCVDADHAPAALDRLALICSSMALQWCADLPRALREWRRRLRPGGWLVVAVPGSRTFHQWRDLCGRHGIEPGLMPSPDLAAWRRQWPADCHVRELEVTATYDDGLAFLRALRTIGADTSRADHRPPNVARMRRLLREPIDVMTYHVLFAAWRRPLES